MGDDSELPLSIEQNGLLVLNATSFRVPGVRQ